MDWATNWTPEQFQQYIGSLENKYFGIFDYYTRYEWDNSTPDNSQHQAMAQHYRDVVKQALSEYDPTYTIRKRGVILDRLDGSQYCGLAKFNAKSKISDNFHSPKFLKNEINFQGEAGSAFEIKVWGLEDSQGLRKFYIRLIRNE